MAGHNHPSYGKIYVILLILFVVSVAGPEVAEILGVEGLTRNLLVLSTAFGIAVWKAYLVCAHFMHLKVEKIYAPYILLGCLSLLFVFFFGTATDAMFANGHNWVKPYSEEEARVAAEEFGKHGYDDHGHDEEGGHGDHEKDAH